LHFFCIACLHSHLLSFFYLTPVFALSLRMKHHRASLGGGFSNNQRVHRRKKVGQHSGGFAQRTRHRIYNITIEKSMAGGGCGMYRMALSASHQRSAMASGA